ncbi:snake venom 5'-nucleotidase [Folsomia candida]|uniref:snake venom 5'-nucleotidase n=1 Tax=Folsomia candida TaxID=158441 RepID=UPI000B8F2CF8|nr:snake venom 5'-nucleotidase [Folsomia candida]
MCQIIVNKSLTLFLLIANLVHCAYPNPTDQLTVTILHTNDVHSRFRETNKYGGSCAESEQRNNQCYGGFARLHHKVQEIRESHKNVLYLSGGDYYQGTVWYTLYKWRVVSTFVNILNHTAMAFGNHEFDDNVSGLVPFLDAATFPLISSNIDDSKEPSIQGKYKKSHVVTLEDGRKVGIIGFTTQETKDISNPGSLIFNDVVASIKAESERLHSEGITMLIAVGHAGYDVDQKIAKEVPLIDVVVGGHTNTFLYTGKAPDLENPLGEYPTIVEQPSGRRVPVVQAYAFGKYLGYLQVNFNSEGEVVSWGGNPILMDASVPQDPTVLELVELWGRNVSDKVKEQIGRTRVFLNGSEHECRLRECSLANLVTDAMVHVNLKFSDSLYWSDVTMAIMNGGGVRASIDEESKNGSISMDDILTVLPFSNTIDLIEIQGNHLREAFEFSVQDYDPKGFHLAGKFLQVSGMRVVYDITQPNGKRVKKLLVRCKECRVPKYVPLDDDTIYKVAVPSYIATGGDGFAIIKENALSHHLQGILDSDMIVEYIKSQGPIIQGVEGRISFETGSADSYCGSSSGLRCQNYWTISILTTLLLILIQKCILY